MNAIEKLTSDVLVVGAGTAGMTAAMTAIESGASVILAVKGETGKVGVAGAGASCCGGSEYGIPRFPGIADDGLWQQHLFNAVIQAGLGTADRRLVSLLVEKIPAAAEKCRDWGVAWGGIGPHSLGYPLVRALAPVIKSSASVLENTIITDLIMDSDGVCIGASGLKEGSPLLIKSRAVILATGGCAGNFRVNVHPPCLNGDGQALALKAGAALRNIEFAQFFPMTVHPSKNLFHFWNESAMKNIHDRHGRSFLEGYLPSHIGMEQCICENIAHAPFSTRDAASRYFALGLMKEIIGGNGGPHGGVYADLRASADSVPPMQKQFLLRRGIDLEKEPVEISMGYQCSNGGVEVDKRGRTSVPGLWAAGEVAGGMHGADRIGGNMLAAAVVWGIESGRDAAVCAKRTPAAAAIKVPEGFPKGKSLVGFDPGEQKTRLRKLAWENLLVLKSEISIKQYLYAAREVLDMIHDNPEISCLREMKELEHSALTGSAIASVSLERRESRGGFYREDYPAINGFAPVQSFRAYLEEGNVKTAEFTADPEWKDNPESMNLERWG